MSDTRIASKNTDQRLTDTDFNRRIKALEKDLAAVTVTANASAAKLLAIKTALATIVITNKTVDTTLDCDAETLPQLCDVVATVVDLIEAAAT